MIEIPEIYKVGTLSQTSERIPAYILHYMYIYNDSYVYFYKINDRTYVLNIHGEKIGSLLAVHSNSVSYIDDIFVKDIIDQYFSEVLMFHVL